MMRKRASDLVDELGISRRGIVPGRSIMNLVEGLETQQMKGTKNNRRARECTTDWKERDGVL
jgi:hypothetical protein